MDSTFDFHVPIPQTPSDPQQDRSTFDPSVFGNSAMAVDMNEERSIWAQSGTATEQAQALTSHDAEIEMELPNQFGTKMVMDPDLTVNGWQANGTATIRRYSDVDCDNEAADRADQNEVEHLLQGTMSSGEVSRSVRVILPYLCGSTTNPISISVPCFKAHHHRSRCLSAAPTTFGATPSRLAERTNQAPGRNASMERGGTDGTTRDSQTGREPDPCIPELHGTSGAANAGLFFEGNGGEGG